MMDMEFQFYLLKQIFKPLTQLSFLHKIRSQWVNAVFTSVHIIMNVRNRRGWSPGQNNGCKCQSCSVMFCESHLWNALWLWLCEEANERVVRWSIVIAPISTSLGSGVEASPICGNRAVFLPPTFNNKTLRWLCSYPHIMDKVTES